MAELNVVGGSKKSKNIGHCQGYIGLESKLLKGGYIGDYTRYSYNGY